MKKMIAMCAMAACAVGVFGAPTGKDAKVEKEIVFVAADPFAVQLKKSVVKHLEERGFVVKDFGATDADPEKPYFKSAEEFCRAITAKDSPAKRGFLFCGTGMGMNMIANRFPGVRAAVVESVWAAKMCRSINDANVLCMGQMLWGEWMANAASLLTRKTAANRLVRGRRYACSRRNSSVWRFGWIG